MICDNSFINMDAPWQVRAFIPRIVSKPVEKQDIRNGMIFLDPAILIPMGYRIKAREHRSVEELHKSQQGNHQGSRNYATCGLVVPGP